METYTTTATLEEFTLGTGAAIFSKVISRAISHAQQEILFVTCFWALSPSLSSLNATLLSLSHNAHASGRKIRVRICISSVSLFQKLFHTRSTAGYVYPPNTWWRKLGLLAPKEFPGLDLAVKSIFVTPVSVMHPKFVIIDRQMVLLPSCNVSWEDWFEGCLQLRGDVVADFVDFWKNFWRTSNFYIPDHLEEIVGDRIPRSHLDIQKHGLLASLPFDSSAPCVLLPHPHRAWPLLFPFHRFFSARLSPLTSHTLSLLQRAQRSVSIQTPNLTTPQVLSELLKALGRGVDVSIVTNDALMTLEQLVTALTTTPRCVRSLIRRYTALQTQRAGSADVGETAPPRIGTLRVAFFRPSAGVKVRNPSRAQTLNSSDHFEPIHSHLKLTVVDEEHIILGSGNMDCASWYTSQELGLGIKSKEIAQQILEAVKRIDGLREKVLYPA